LVVCAHTTCGREARRLGPQTEARRFDRGALMASL